MHQDLTHPLSEDTPVYPGDPAPQINPAAEMGLDGYTDHSFTLGTHHGTHIDAPSHMIEGGKTLDQYPPDRFFGRGLIIDATRFYDLETVKAAGIQAGDIVLFHTGLAAKYTDPSYFEDFPALPKGIAEYLVQQKVSIVGFDCCGPDHDPFPIHKILLAGDVLIVENLCNLEKLKGAVEITALPLNLALDGAPCRVVAKL